MHHTLQNNKAWIKKQRKRTGVWMPSCSIISIVCSLGLMLELRSWEEHESGSLLWVLSTFNTSQLCCYTHYLSVWGSTMPQRTQILSKQLRRRCKHEQAWAATTLSETIPNTVMRRAWSAPYEGRRAWSSSAGFLIKWIMNVQCKTGILQGLRALCMNVSG